MKILTYKQLIRLDTSELKQVILGKGYTKKTKEDALHVFGNKKHNQGVNEASDPCAPKHGW